MKKVKPKYKLWSVVMFYPHDIALQNNTGVRKLGEQPVKGVITGHNSRTNLYEIAFTRTPESTPFWFGVKEEEITKVIEAGKPSEWELQEFYT